MMALWVGLAPPGPVDRVRTVIEAEVADDLSAVVVRVRAEVRPSTSLERVHVILAAERYRTSPQLNPTAQRSQFPLGFAPGGFEDVKVTMDGAPCLARVQVADAAAQVCEAPVAAGGTAEVVASARLIVPARFGPFGRRGRHLSLLGGWYPYPARVNGDSGQSGEAFVGAQRVRLTIPAGFGAVIGGQWFPPVPGTARRVLEHEVSDATQVAVAVVPPWTQGRPVANGRALFVSARLPSGDAGDLREAKEIVAAVQDGLSFLDDLSASHPALSTFARQNDAPLIVLEAPLRYELARATFGAVWVSELAFRLTPVDRFLRFHRLPLLRELFTEWALVRISPEDPLRHVAADAMGAWLLDRYVAARFGRAEDAFDVLSLWSFIPAVDSLLYAPQLPFVSAYFRLIREEDPLHDNLIDFPSAHPRGKVIYEKLLDRRPSEVSEVFLRVARGRSLQQAVRPTLGDQTEEFFATWLGPYPAVQYAIAGYDSQPSPACEGEPCFSAQVKIARTGDAVAEPVQVALTDEDGARRVVWSLPTSEVERVLTATLGLPLAEVELDPYGRLAETPTLEVPSPKLDNRSHPKWRFLLNNFNILFSPTSGNLDTAVDVGFSRVRDVRWRFAARAAYAPEAVTMSTRASYGFGAPVTPDQLAQWIGAVVGVEYLRPEFAGTKESAVALSGALYFGYDDRTTAWAPEAGTALRASLSYSHVAGEPAADSEVTADAISLTVRGLRSWRVGGGQQVSLRGSAGMYLAGTPRPQLLYALGGRTNLRGYVVDDAVGRVRGIASAEWVHPLLSELDENAMEAVWATGLDGALYADVGVIGDDLGDVARRPVRADVGYGFRIYLDYFGVRPGVMAVDIAFPLVDGEGRFGLGPPAVYIDFAQSFLSF